MMSNMRSAGGLVRRTPASPTWSRPPRFALVALAILGLVQGGCRSDGCGTCGGFFSRTATNLGNGVQALGAKVFHHGGPPGCSTCGGDDGGYVDSGVPIVAPGGMVVPAPGTVIPGPVQDSTPAQLEPIPSSATQPVSPGGGMSNSSRNVPGNTRSVYETSNPRGSVARGKPRSGEIARAHLARPESVPASADSMAGSSDLLDRVPPVDLPTDFNRKATATPVPSLGDPAANTSSTPTASEGPAADAGSSTLSAAIAVTPRQAPGIQRSAYVSPSIGGGSAPSLEGLDWLKEKGYKTFIDLRQRPEIESTYIDSVNDLDMVYISLPIVADHLAAARVARFEDLIAQASHRPIYFCDVNGTRAGLLWYLHLRSVVGEDRESARQKAEELGMDVATLKHADAYLAGQKAHARANSNRDLALRAEVDRSAAHQDPIPGPPSSASSTPVNAAPPVIPTPEPPLTLPDSPPAPMTPGEENPRVTTTTGEVYREPSGWKVLAAFVLTGLGVPLAYWSKTAISGSRAVRRASLPAAARRSISGPAGSDA